MLIMLSRRLAACDMHHPIERKRLAKGLYPCLPDHTLQRRPLYNPQAAPRPHAFSTPGRGGNAAGTKSHTGSHPLHSPFEGFDAGISHWRAYASSCELDGRGLGGRAFNDGGILCDTARVDALLDVNVAVDAPAGWRGVGGEGGGTGGQQRETHQLVASRTEPQRAANRTGNAASRRRYSCSMHGM